MRPALDSLANGFPYLIFYLVVVSAIYIIGLFKMEIWQRLYISAR